MHRSIIIKALLVGVIGIAALVAACSSAPAASTTPAATPAAKPAETAQPATTPAKQEPPATPAAAITTSFAASTYTNDAYKFSVMYPKAWASSKVTEPHLLSARDPGQVPVLDVRALDTDKVDQQLQAVWDAVPMKNIKYVTKGKEMTTTNGKVKGTYDVYTSDYPTTKLRTYSFSFPSGQKTINFSITTADGFETEKLFLEVFNTITLK